MGKFALIIKLGNEDIGVTLNENAYVKIASLQMFNTTPDVSYDEFLKRLKKLALRPSEVAMDLFVIACAMYAADTRIERKKFGEDSWTRLIDLFIPVSSPDLWNAQKNHLETIFRFLTGDIWNLNFRIRTNLPVISPVGNRQSYQMPYQTNTVCLFSGGMDSFIGAVDLLEQSIRPLLVGHAKSADVTTYQTKCANAISSAYISNKPERIYAYIRITKDQLFNSIDNTERGRSFLFLTLGAVCASALSQHSHLIIPENGMISLNLPLTPLRIGSHSTRTTHPKYLQMMQTLFMQLGLNVELNNPYQFKTKGEMLRDCRNQTLVASTQTMSCSHPAAGRYKGGIGSSSRHCGYCVPCIIRKAAFRFASINDPSPYGTDLDTKYLDITKPEGADVLAFKYMIGKIRRYPSYLTSAIRTTGPLGNNVEPYIDVYSRSLNEVEQLLNGVILTV